MLTTEAADGEYDDYVMVALKPRQDVISAIAAMPECSEDERDLHLTLLYLGKKADVGGERGRERLYHALYSLALDETPSLVGKMNGFGWFFNDDADVLLSLWDIPYLSEVRTRLLDKCRSHGVPLRTENHGFNPHLTLAYHDPDEGDRTVPAIPEGAGEPVEFASLWLCWGEEWQEVVLT